MQADVSGRRRSSEGASASASFLTCSRLRSSKMETNLRERKRGDVSRGHGVSQAAMARMQGCARHSLGEELLLVLLVVRRGRVHLLQQGPLCLGHVRGQYGLDVRHQREEHAERLR